MSAECGSTQPSVTPADLQDLHRKYLELAREAFFNKKTMASQNEVTAYLDRLTKVQQILLFIYIFNVFT